MSAKGQPKVRDTVWPSEGGISGLNQDGFVNQEAVRLQQFGPVRARANKHDCSQHCRIVDHLPACVPAAAAHDHSG